jgi:hypothetical protein
LKGLRGLIEVLVEVGSGSVEPACPGSTWRTLPVLHQHPEDHQGVKELGEPGPLALVRAKGQLIECLKVTLHRRGQMSQKTLLGVPGGWPKGIQRREQKSLLADL